jgi:signal-transduction protein with cAMP-binding, CBS, and nucleotidyltransferase domain
VRENKGRDVSENVQERGRRVSGGRKASRKQEGDLAMAQKVSEVMTPAPVAVMPGQPVRDAAQAMRDYGIGAVLVAENGKLTGLVTDRDIVVRAVADGRDPGSSAQPPNS